MTNALGGITTYTYDEVGRRTSVTDVSGNTTSMFYNALGKIERVCYPNGSSKVFEYEIGGRLKKSFIQMVRLKHMDMIKGKSCFSGKWFRKSTDILL